jgi:ornithine cyclodeaminase/alanine dehydrogenase-like protein (mu-crystallin family)
MKTLVLSRSDVARALSLSDCIAAVERAFRLHGEGAAAPPVVAGVHVAGGGFHIKAGVLEVNGRAYFAAKTNANFPGNRERHNLPTIQGTIAVCDATNGAPLAVMDSIEITVQRTAAATAVAAKYLARANAVTLAIVGCGVQSRAQLRAVCLVRAVRRALAYDISAEARQRFAREMAEELGIQVDEADSAATAVRAAEMVVTCTVSRRAFVGRDDVAPGAFVSGVGADNEEKSELAPELLAASHVVTDVTAQCATIGDLHHAVAAGAMQAGDVYGELGEVVCGKKPGRAGDDEVWIFDSTGMALQDVAAAAVAYENALRLGIGVAIELG